MKAGTRETRNAKIESVRIEREDHGILTAWVYLDYGGSGQGFGGFCLDSYDSTTKKRKFSGHLAMFVSRVLEVVGVSCWESLPGRSVRVDADRGTVYRIGNFLSDNWFDPREEFEGPEVSK